MNKTMSIVLGAVLILAAALYVAFYQSNLRSVTVSPEALNQAQKTLADEQGAKAQNRLDVSSFYKGPVKERLESVMKAGRLYEAVWTRVVKLPVPERDIYMGMLEKSYGNGVLEDSPMPLLLVDGTFYIPWSYGGVAYDIKETNWIWRYKELAIDRYYPLERYMTSVDMEDILTYKLKEGIDSISLKLYKDGLVESGSVTIGENIITFDALNLVLYQPVTLSKLDEFINQPSYNRWGESTRKLAGYVSQQGEYVSWTGYTIKHPAVFNGKKVVKLQEGNTETFSVQDDMYAPDYAQLSCYQNPQNQVGPFTDQPTPIATSSRSKLLDWGYKKEYHADYFSFTGPGYYCTFYAAEAFRPEMFEISF